ncbi:MAG: hypothetical protein ABR90_05685 [Cryomorphaceae bacterium BACL29 MAG-121220-bin8]|jgi:heme-degrading monooxygenase HmoA|nr:MAG: hypothetical protein ABR90_05685 [Cryomorphaceae bacterium BACL29 MAG-121220-bin8]|tara:strand:+ start:65876 stop:66544 length:669 start_codon:yes stop_codon:yes gene_type:complete
MIATISFFKYNKNKFWAFTQMHYAFEKMNKTPNLKFFKLLGTGSGNGFSLFPDFSTYSILCVWENKSSALNFINESQHALSISEMAYSRKDFLLNPIKSHGKWNGINPFKTDSERINKDSKIGIITRATVNASRMLEFWKSVPDASNAIKNATGVEWFKGIGEWPFIQQATFSVWDNLESVKNFAYNSGSHAEIIKKTRKRKWYKEDLFARFEIMDSYYKIF